jgi:patatin-like phospholipase/acyl hydrolase
MIQPMAISILKIMILVIVLMWVLFWKGYSVWTAARNGQKRWFIALIILNTLSILDIIYIFYVANKTPEDIKNVLKSKI